MNVIAYFCHSKWYDEVSKVKDLAFDFRNESYNYFMPDGWHSMLVSYSLVGQQ